MKLLIVENNSGMRRLIAEIVAGEGNDVFECADGAETLSIYREYLPDWVVFGVSMRERDGIGAARQIFAHFPAARIVVVTDYQDDDLCRAAREAGASEYLVKENLLELRRIIAS